MDIVELRINKLNELEFESEEDSEAF